MLAKREKSIEILYDIVREIAGLSSLQDVLNSVKDGISSALDAKCEIFVKDIENNLIFDEKLPISKNEKEKAAALWVFQNGNEAGWSTSTLPFAQNLYIPLKGSHGTVGVLAFQPRTDKVLSWKRRILYTQSDNSLQTIWNAFYLNKFLKNWNATAKKRKFTILF